MYDPATCSHWPIARTKYMKDLICDNSRVRTVTLPYVKLQLTVFEKSFGQTSYSKSFISKDISMSRINKKLAINLIKKLLILFKHYNKGIKDV
jgi:hypothetical protein